MKLKPMARAANALRNSWPAPVWLRAEMWKS
jgi:hypothetical protein